MKKLVLYTLIGVLIATAISIAVRIFGFTRHEGVDFIYSPGDSFIKIQCVFELDDRIMRIIDNGNVIPVYVFIDILDGIIFPFTTIEKKIYFKTYNNKSREFNNFENLVRGKIKVSFSKIVSPSIDPDYLFVYKMDGEVDIVNVK